MSANASQNCVQVHGGVKCKKDPAKHANVEIRVYDRDGVSLFKLIDPDDLMGVTTTKDDGSFQLEGCGDDFDWFPGVANNQEPYVQIRHYCNSDRGETIKMPIFSTFVPNQYEMGVVELDEVNPHVTDGNENGNGNFNGGNPNLNGANSNFNGAQSFNGTTPFAQASKR
ncbi:Transthyretin-like family protein [Aphelenchoides avenae]|nr:Transthyretin-like family protein [Aphelenchus avenae]